ncbi:MAG TPA: D-ribose ABC transporter substrate-binding protein [Gammaproteobacteria bacterium]|nr:D-ribose ABC transporter substrate-binding protein [Gammaproteobacteria bacterium]
MRKANRWLEASAKLAASVALVVGGLAAFAGGAQAADTGKLITVITPSHSNQFFKAEADAAVEKAKSLGYKTSSLVHHDDPDKLLKLVQTAISDGSAALVIDNAGADASISSVKRAEKAGIPVFLIDREINANGLAQAQIVSNNSQCATAVGQKFAELLNYKGKYVELVGRSTDTNAQVRSQGFHRVLDQIDSLKMVAQQSANWDQTEGYNVTQSMIQAHPDIAGVISGNDTMALGAAAALKNAGMNDVVVVGIDGNPDVVDQIRSGGIIKATGLQQATRLAKMAVEQADTYLKTGKTGKPEKQSVECVLVTKENAGDVRSGGFGMK